MFSAVGFQGRRKSFDGVDCCTAAIAPASSTKRMKAWSQFVSSQPRSRFLISEKSTIRPTSSTVAAPPAATTSTSTR